ncbi:MAG: hypothetical protein PHH37_14595 [Paludibacter sp.]|nr:hypothetical protein [Paludibacter sp.]
MKKIIYFIFSIIVVEAFFACEDYNIKNFPGYEDMGRPTNVASYTDTLTAADFVTIGNAVKKPIETLISTEEAKITAKETELKNATNATDSATIQAELDALTIKVNETVDSLKNDSAYIAGTFLATNKYFTDQYTAYEYAPVLLNEKYLYADVNSSVLLTYKYVSADDTVDIPAEDKYTLTTEDYDIFGSGDDQPGKYNNFSSSIDQDLYIPKLLAVKYPLVLSGTVKMIRYKYYSGSTIERYSLYMFDGIEWQPYSKTEQFVFSESYVWVFDPTITFTASKDDYLLAMQYLYKHDGETYPLMEGYNDWTTDDTLKFVYNPKYPPSSDELSNVYTEYMFGLSWNFGNIDTRIISRTYSKDTELHAYFTSVDADASLDDDGKKDAKNAYIETRVKQGLALLLSLKYPDLEPKVRDVNQYVKLNVQLYDGTRWYWTYKYQCVAPGIYEYVERTTWK